jgi:hypothetical protein
MSNKKRGVGRVSKTHLPKTSGATYNDDKEIFFEIPINEVVDSKLPFSSFLFPEYGLALFIKPSTFW